MTAHRFCLKSAGVCAVLLAVAGAADAATYSECQDRARQVSGYNGPVPNSQLPGGVGRGAMRGAVGGAAVGWVGGNDSGRAAGRGAAVGAVVGGVRRASARNDQEQRQWVYQQELDRCMGR